MRKEVKEYMDSVVMTIVKSIIFLKLNHIRLLNNLFFMILLSISRKKRYMMI